MSSIDRPGSDLTLKYGLLLDATDLRDGLPDITVHAGVDPDTLDWRVVKTVKVGWTQQREAGGGWGWSVSVSE